MTDNTYYLNMAKNVLMEIKKSVVGKDEVICKIMMAILARGHVLIEDIPGVGKTTILHELLKCTGEVTPINILENMPEIFAKLKEEYPNRSIVNIGYEEAKSKIKFWDTNYVLQKEEPSVTRSVLGLTRLVLGVGEIHDYVTAIYPLIAKQFYGSVQVIFSHHAMNAHDMVTSIKNCLLERGASLDEAVAATAKLFDVYVHVDKIDGSFCITEIDSVNLQNIRELSAGN